MRLGGGFEFEDEFEQDVALRCQAARNNVFREGVADTVPPPVRVHSVWSLPAQYTSWVTQSAPMKAVIVPVV